MKNNRFIADEFRSVMPVIAQSTPIYYCVCFYNYNGKCLLEVFVQSGCAATPPGDPTRDGYLFTGWDQNYLCITEDMNIKATYVKEPVEIDANTNPIKIIPVFKFNIYNAAFKYDDNNIHTILLSKNLTAIAGYYEAGNKP